MPEISVHPISREDWLHLAPGFFDYNYRQMWDYAQSLASRRAAVSNHVQIRSGTEVLGLADVRVKRVPVLGGLAYISGGPLVRKGRPDDLEHFASCVIALRNKYVHDLGLIL